MLILILLSRKILPYIHNSLFKISSIHAQNLRPKILPGVEGRERKTEDLFLELLYSFW